LNVSFRLGDCPSVFSIQACDDIIYRRISSARWGMRRFRLEAVELIGARRIDVTAARKRAVLAGKGEDRMDPAPGAAVARARAMS